MTYQAQIPLGGLPVHLVLVGDNTQGRVVFVKVAPVGLIFDQRERSLVSAWFDESGFTLFDQHESADYQYDTMYEYKELPLMLKWLQQQNLPQPA